MAVQHNDGTLTRSEKVVLGADIGASHSRAWLVAGAEVLAAAEAGSASVAAEGAEAALSALDDLLGQLPIDRHQPLDAICVGAAGMASEEVLSVFEGRLARFTRGGPVLVVADGYLVLPAAGLAEGVGVICGTGTTAVASQGDRVSRVGGWGYLLGDDGSGYWFVRRAIRALLDRSDRRRQLGALGADLLRAVGVDGADDLKDLVFQDPRPGRWAAYAPAVLQSSDPEVACMLAEAASALDQLVDAAMESVGGRPGLPIVLAGGMTKDPRFRSAVTEQMGRARPDSTVSILQAPPVTGAVRLAQLAIAGPVLGGVRRLR